MGEKQIPREWENNLIVSVYIVRMKTCRLTRKIMDAGNIIKKTKGETKEEMVKTNKGTQGKKEIRKMAKDSGRIKCKKDPIYEKDKRK